MARLTLIAIGFVLTACSSTPSIVQLTDDTYRIEKSDKGGIFGNAIEMREEVLRQADSFAAEKGKVAEKVILNERPVGFGRLARVEYTFRLVDPQQEIEAAVESIEERGDFYTELIKLDDLRERGIITDEEFAAEKRELLDSTCPEYRRIVGVAA